MVFTHNSKAMDITDRDVVQRLIHPDVFAKLAVTDVSVEGVIFGYKSADSVELKVAPIVTWARGIERKDWIFPNGRLTIERDGLEVLAEVFQKQTDASGTSFERKVLRCALRDRQLDGTELTSPLCGFPNTHEATNKLPHPDFKAAELSIYCYDPERYLPASEMLDFIMKLDDYLYKRFEPAEFFRLWKKAFEASNMAPWQPAPPLKGVAQHFVEAAGKVLTEVGYHRMDAVCGWYNVVMFFLEKMGFVFTYGEHEAAFGALQNGLQRLEQKVGRKLNLRERAWVVALQNIPAAFIPDALNLHARWINTPTYTNYVCRIHKDLSPFPRDSRVDGLVLPDLFASKQKESVETTGGVNSTSDGTSPAIQPAPSTLPSAS